MSSAAELPSGREPLCGCRGGWRRLQRAAAAARSPERRRRRCGAAAGERRGGDADVAAATCRSSRARPSSPYPAACTSHRHRCGLLRLRRGEAQLGRRRRPQAISYAVRSGRLDGHALLLLLAADIIPHGERHYGHAVWRRAPSRVPAGRGGDGVGAPGPRLAEKVLAIQLGSLGADQRSGDEADGRGQRDASQLACGRVVVGRLGTPTASIGGGAASPACATPPAFNAAAAAAGAEEATTRCRHLRGDVDASRGGETQAALTRSWARRENSGGGCIVAGREGVEHSGG
uniref:Uncharacterized protein n=1 Tax=Oryza glumipatula TaxID=40148 RepID=A0A0D9Y719_9ORYZ